MSMRKGLEDQIVRLKQSVSDNCAEEVQFCYCTLWYFDVYFLICIFSLWQSKTSCSMVRSGSGLGNTAFVSKSGKLREALSGQRGTISKIFEEGNFTSWKTTRSYICLSWTVILTVVLAQLTPSWSSKRACSVEVWGSRCADPCCQGGC